MSRNFQTLQGDGVQSYSNRHASYRHASYRHARQVEHHAHCTIKEKFLAMKYSLGYTLPARLYGEIVTAAKALYDADIKGVPTSLCETIGELLFDSDAEGDPAREAAATHSPVSPPNSQVTYSDGTRIHDLLIKGMQQMDNISSGNGYTNVSQPGFAHEILKLHPPTKTAKTPVGHNLFNITGATVMDKALPFKHERTTTLALAAASPVPDSLSNSSQKNVTNGDITLFFTYPANSNRSELCFALHS